MTAVRFAFWSLFFAVILGAFGAHLLKDKLPAESLSAWQTAVGYQLIHSMGILLVNSLHHTPYQLGPAQIWVNRLLISGILTFSGSIYLLSTQIIHGLNLKFLGPITPIGGICFITAWGIAAVQCGKKMN